VPFIESDFVRFTVLLLPGFWAMWIYKPFVYRGHIIEHWENDLTLAIMFGFTGYIAAGIALHYGLVSTGLGSLVVSSLVSIIIAIIMGFLARHNIFVTYLPSWLDSKIEELPNDRPHGRSIEHFYQEFILKQDNWKDRVQVAKTYAIGFPEKAEIGVIRIKSDRYNEIGLDCYPHLEHDFFDKNKEKITLWTKIVNLDTGFVIEIANVEKELIKSLIKKEFDGYYKS